MLTKLKIRKNLIELFDKWFPVKPEDPYPENATINGWSIIRENGAVWIKDNNHVPVSASLDSEMEFVKAVTFYKPKSVLIGGLGLGNNLIELQKCPYVQKIVVIEKHQEVIDLVGPHFLPKMRNLKIINADVFKFEPKKLYEMAWFSIWNDKKSFEKIDVLRFKYSHHVTSWLGFYGEPITFFGKSSRR